MTVELAFMSSRLLFVQWWYGCTRYIWQRDISEPFLKNTISFWGLGTLHIMLTETFPSSMHFKSVIEKWFNSVSENKVENIHEYQYRNEQIDSGQPLNINNTEFMNMPHVCLIFFLSEVYWRKIKSHGADVS